jgi:hypothetical protein
MKVIELGEQGSSPWKKQLRCTGKGNHEHTACGALLEVEYEDLRYWKGSDTTTWGGSDPAVGFKCPICFAVTDIEYNQWPISYNKLPVFTIEWKNRGHKDYIEERESGK